MDIRALLTLSLIVIISLVLMTQQTKADASLDQKRHDLDEVIAKMDRLNYLPNLLPIIMENSDFIGLTQSQVAGLDAWRNTNKPAMLVAMQKIVAKRIEIKEAALSPTISSARLIKMQNDIFRLQREVLEHKLSCREQIVKNFNEENWISFFMVLADENIGISVPPDYADAKRLQYAN